MKPGTTINAMAAAMAAALGSSPQYPGILRQDRRDRIVADPIIAVPNVKAHIHKIHARRSGKKKNRTGTYKGRELNGTEVKLGSNSTTGTKV